MILKKVFLPQFFYLRQGPETEESSSSEEHSTYKGLAYLLFGGLLIGFFSEPFITAIVEIASQAKVKL